jgi:hypothetical protein
MQRAWVLKIKRTQCLRKTPVGFSKNNFSFSKTKLLPKFTQLNVVRNYTFKCIKKKFEK